MGFASRYLTKQTGFKPHISDPPSDRLRFIMVIPVFCEPDLTSTLESIWKTERTVSHAEVILVVNSSENADSEITASNKNTKDAAAAWISDHQDPILHFHIIHVPDLPARDAGVGLARKTGMDEAIYRFDRLGNPNGYILSFDADSRCDPDYFTTIENTVNTNPALGGFDIYFEHPVEGNEFPDNIYRAITDYELHLRYVNQFLRFAGFPFAHHTVGSCFGVRADIYAAQGGMNKRKAGEDFYFLHKVIPLGNFADIHDTRVIPSPRESFRVPFGTGPAITRYLASEKEMVTYAPECFMALRQFLAIVPGFFKATAETVIALTAPLPAPIREYLEITGLPEALKEINANSGSPDSFCNRFYRWFDAFRIVKYLNFVSLTHYPRVPVTTAAKQLLEYMKQEGNHDHKNARELLTIFRRMERGQ